MPESAVTWYPDRKDTVSWNVKEVVRDLDGEPHLLVGLELTGVDFAHRALTPFMRVGKVESRLVLIDADGLTARGYFDRPVPDGEDIEFGYGDQVVLVVHGKLRRDLIATLDRARIPRHALLYDRRDDAARPG